MRPVVSRFIHDGNADRDQDAALGEPVWGPLAWLRDLELRLGLAPVEVSDAERAHAYAMRLQAGLDRAPFYARSLEVDPHGTATTLLAWRDQLVEAGWCGQEIPGAGPRVAALVAAENAPLRPIPLGPADRLARVELELADTTARLYDTLQLLESPKVWPEGWRRVLGALYGLGTKIEERKAPTFTPTGASDLAWTQDHLSVPRRKAEKCAWRGDGSLVHLTGRTSWDLGETVAGMMRSLGTSDVLVIRLGDPAPLEAAFELQGLSSQGQGSTSPLRSPLQVLSLALSLMFAPRDPYRALEMLTLPRAPLGPYASRMLADAIGRAPGIGSRSWEAAKAKLRTPDDPNDPIHVEAAAASTSKIETWFEGPTFDRATGAPRGEVVSVITRVREWARRRPHHDSASVPPSAGMGVNWAALSRSASDLEQFVLAHPREVLFQNEIEELASRAIGSGMRHDVSTERAGRLPHVSSPHAVMRQHDAILVWHAGYDANAGRRSPPWRAAELRAFEAAGYQFADADLAVTLEGDAWRRAFLSARSTFAVATAETHLSDAQPSLPLWDEIVARSNATDVDVKRVSLGAWGVLDRAHVAQPLTALPLPSARGVWSADPAAMRRALERTKALYPTAVENLVACPLRWVLESVLQVRRSRLSSVPEKTQLYGTLGHRLAEELHRIRVLDQPEKVGAIVEALLDDLIEREGGPLLMPGMTAERGQVRQVLLDAMRELSKTIADSDMSVTDVEVKTTAPWEGRELGGRIDLLLSGKDGKEAILDLKYGESRYRAALADGLALQIAMYAETRRRQTGATAPIEAAYFALKKRRTLALVNSPFKNARSLEGDPLHETWEKTERAVLFLLDRMAKGTVLASAAAEDDKVRFFAHHELTLPDGQAPYDPPATSACTYCSNGALCGRSWKERS